MSHKNDWDMPRPAPHHGIKCLTCQAMVYSKRELPKRHKGHEVVYLDANGEPER